MVPLRILIGIRFIHHTTPHIKAPRPRPQLRHQVSPLACSAHMRAIDRSHSPARDSVLLDNDAATDVLALGFEQSLGVPLPVVQEACDDAARDVDEEDGCAADQEDACPGFDSERWFLARPSLFGGFWGCCSGLGEFDVFWLGGGGDGDERACGAVNRRREHLG
jgi:hypothetical protein